MQPAALLKIRTKINRGRALISANLKLDDRFIPVSSVEQMAPRIGKRQERKGRQEWDPS